MNKLTPSQSCAISFLRISAMILILSCHYLQAYNNKWAWLLNIGVQMFLCISGYLYGTKEILNWKDWFFNRLKKLYIPFAIFLIFTIPILSRTESITLKQIVVYIFNLQGLLGNIPGITHLWFMTAIMVCYIITPILQKLKSHSSVCFLLLVITAILEYGIFQIRLGNFSWFFLYSACYFYPNMKKNSQIGIWIISIVITAYMSIFIIDWETILQYNNWINRLFHDILGLTIILTGIRLSFILKMTTIPKVLSIIDKHSFPIYITHHVFLLGPIAIIHARWGAYITLIITILTAHLLNITSNKITKIITKRI